MTAPVPEPTQQGANQAQEPHAAPEPAAAGTPAPVPPVYEAPAAPQVPPVPAAPIYGVPELEPSAYSAPAQPQAPQQTTTAGYAGQPEYGQSYGQQSPYAQPQPQAPQQAYAVPQQAPQYAQPQPQQQYPGYNAGYTGQQPQYAGAAPYAAGPVGTKSKMAAGLLGIFLGSLGVHNFYLGNTGKAVAQLLLTIIGWIIIIGPLAASIWGLVEGILILCSKPGSPWHKDSDGYELQD